ncbi:hypothetical protein DPMN_047730 [Dreissena polymorpha]|uniref:Uncharacterized protein n=1 Tax=Dreissena polymorpha TaxID=45954 RepID=A0A9D4DA91_DREPO|nr:hypothetical protein DPMN_047730 [Dreissena polymorpha]
MPKSQESKRRDRNSINKSKHDLETSLSGLLNQTNSVIYGSDTELKGVNFEKEIRKVWVTIEDRAKATEKRVKRLDDRVDFVDMGSNLMSTRVSDLERQRDELHEERTYLQAM